MVRAAGRRAACRPDALRRAAAARALEKQRDIVDVWFESGVSWAAVAEGKLVPTRREGRPLPRGRRPAPRLVPLVAADRRRRRAATRPTRRCSRTAGCSTSAASPTRSRRSRRRAPRARRSTTSIPRVWMEKNGAELLRLWTAAADYQDDIVFSQTILNQLGESYRKIRNTCRFLLSNLYDFVPARDGWRITSCASWTCWRWACCASATTRSSTPTGATSSTTVVRLLDRLRSSPMSAEYLDPIKDALYCEAPASRVRRSVQTALHEMVRTMATWMAPILCFTAAGCRRRARARRPASRSTCTAQCASIDPRARQKSEPEQALDREIRPRREAILAQLEPFRAAGHKSLEARVQVTPTRRRAAALAVEPRPPGRAGVVSRVDLDPQTTRRARRRSPSTRRPGRPARAAGGGRANRRAPAPPTRTCACAVRPSTQADRC